MEQAESRHIGKMNGMLSKIWRPLLRLLGEKLVRYYLRVIRFVSFMYVEHAGTFFHGNKSLFGMHRELAGTERNI